MITRKQQMTACPNGFTLVELMVVIAIIGVLAGIAIPSMSHYIYKAKVARTIFEIKSIEAAANAYKYENDEYPPDLKAIGYDNIKDNWGNPYVYTRFAGSPIGALRKDKFLHPVNTDFDLYSKGRDGQSKNPFTAPVSKDDIVRANNGGYVGLVSNY